MNCKNIARSILHNFQKSKYCYLKIGPR